MAALRREEVRRLRHACRHVSETVHRLRAMRVHLGEGPAYREARKSEALEIPDAVDASVFYAVRPLDPSIALGLGERLYEAREALGYARTALEERTWDAAKADLDRTLLALQEIEIRLQREIPPPWLPWRLGRI